VSVVSTRVVRSVNFILKFLLLRGFGGVKVDGISYDVISYDVM
jgi:hypothetical protein